MGSFRRMSLYQRVARGRLARFDATHLRSTWTVGKVRFTHADSGFICFAAAQMSPSDFVLGPYESANKAVEAAERLGEGHAAFRMVQSSAGNEAREPLSLDDLPVNLD
jgi:hypothetical protein